MRCFSISVIAALGLISPGPLPGQDDPFAPREKTSPGETPQEETRVREIRLDIDSIELPHDQANASIRTMSGALTGGTKTRELALQSIAAGQGKRLHRQFLTVRCGGKSRTDSIQEYPYPTEFDPPMLGMITKPGPPQVVEPFFTPATPQSFEFRHLGWTLEAEVSGDPGSGWLELNLAHHWTSLTGEHAWSRDYAEVKKPGFHYCNLDSKFPVPRGEWVLAGLLRRPNPEAEGVGGAFVPGRVLTFVRALWGEDAAPATKPGKPPKGGTPKPPPAAGFLHEWIEIGQAEATALLVKYPGVDQSGPLRKELQDRIGKGQANLLETTYHVMRNGLSKVQSITEISDSANQSNSSGPQPMSGQQSVPPSPTPTYERLFFGDTPRIPPTFEDLRIGIEVQMELTCVRNSGPFSVNTQARMIRLLGIRCHGQGAEEYQRLEAAECPTTFAGLLIAGQPCLFASMDSPPPASLSLLRGPIMEKPAEKTLLLFLTALP
jgi:hypothetical protein